MKVTQTEGTCMIIQNMAHVLAVCWISLNAGNVDLAVDKKKEKRDINP